MRRQGEEPGLFLRQGFGHGPRRVAGDSPGVGDGVAPLLELRVQVGHVPEGSGREERGAEVLHRPFHAALLQSRRLQPMPLIRR